MRKFNTLAEAVLAASDSDTIELRGNGPFVVDPVTIVDRRVLTIRAGNAFRPVIKLAPGTGEDNPHLLSTNGPLVLEGLELRSDPRPTATSSIGFCAVAVSGGDLRVANCRFVTPFRHAIYAPLSRQAFVRNCEFLSSREWCDALTGECATAGTWEVENCVQVGGNNVHHRLGNGPPEPADAMIWWGSPTGALPVANTYDLTAWRKFWGSPETGSIQSEIRYRGGDLAGRLAGGADQLTPDDFRLRPDSAGYRAGKNGKDLGAEVDIVGPGLAYERWKKTPEYQKWLAETRRMK